MSRRSNTFVLVKDVINYEKRKGVNLRGVVTEFSIPRKSRGSDYVTSLKIVDESQQSPELQVHVFTETLDELPHINNYRDYIVLFRIEIRRRNGELFAFFNKKESSFALLDGKFTIGVLPYQASSRCGSLAPDKDSITLLRKWCRISQFDAAGTSQYILSLKDIDKEEFFDIVCKVLHIREVSQDVWMLFVWDGTDTPTPRSEDEHNRLSLQIELLPLPTDISSSFPRMGTIFRVIADPAYKNLGQHFQGNDKWIRIRNITRKVRSGVWYGLLTPTSKIRLLPDQNSIVSEHIRNYKNRIREMGCVPLSTSSSCSLTGA